MKSLVVLLVEHGETTDPLTNLIDDIRHKPGVEDWDLQVDVNPYEDFTIDFTGDTAYLRRYRLGDAVTP